MRKLTFLLLLTAACISAKANEVRINPTPQAMKWGGKQIHINEIRISGGEQADAETVKKLKTLFKTTEDKKAFPVYIGEKGEKAVKKYASLIPESAEGYYLKVSDNEMVIAGYDERGTFYALQTLVQLLENQAIPEIEITDYPDIAHRGTVEGFYGQPWSHRDRISQLNFYGANKLNTYIYGPKDDPYHSSPNWRKAYPSEEATQIRELVETAKVNKVDFVWAIHPGQDIKWNEEDRKLLLDKFEGMYQLGVRSFAVFFDDISGEGTDANRQAELLNFLHQQFVKAKKDVTPLIMCPTQYNKSWSDPKPGTYLDILGDKLDASIRVMWTGDRVISDITTEGLEGINKRLKRKAYIWWNFPVNDYVRDHLLLGRSYGLDTTAGKLMSGFVSNPMDKAEASKIAIYSVADYAWNTSRYDSRKSWEEAIHDVMPQTAEAFRIFAAHNSDLGKNGHGYRREESVEIKPAADRVITGLLQNDVAAADLDQLEQEFSKIEKVPGILLAANENPALLSEIAPWLTQFEILGRAGQASLQLFKALNSTQSTPESNWNQYCYLQKLTAQKENNSKNNNQNPYQPGIKTGSLVLHPLVETFTQWNARQLYKQLNKGEEQAVSNNVQTQARLLTDIDQLKLVQLQTSDQSAAVTPLLEVVKINAGQNFAIELPLTINTGSLDANLNNKDFPEWGKIEISEDGTTWKALETEVKGTNLTARFSNQPMKMIRLVNSGNTTREFHLKKFVLLSAQLSGQGGNSLTAIDGDLSTSFTLSGTRKFEKTISGAPTQVTILTSPDATTNLTVVAIDSQNQKHKLDRILSAFATLKLPANVIALEITSDSPVNLHEIIWQ